MNKPFFFTFLFSVTITGASLAQTSPATTAKETNSNVSSQSTSRLPENAAYLLNTSQGTFPMTRAQMEKSLEPSWIESITVVKDKSVLEKFKVEDKDGAIFIELKKDKEQEALAQLRNSSSAAIDQDPGNKKAKIKLDGPGSAGTVKTKALFVLKAGAKQLVLNQENVSSLNPRWIESVNVLKNAAATSLFGDKAKEGAVIVTLKAEHAQEALQLFKDSEQLE
ncbi:MAG: hypothetical protein ACO1OQ_03895 [Rufibacter sp.]